MPVSSTKIALYASIGNELTHYDIDVAGATLTRRGSVGLPANVQYAWPHASRPLLYVATSDSASGMGPAGANHHLSALRIDRDSGALSRPAPRCRSWGRSTPAFSPIRFAPRPTTGR